MASHLPHSKSASVFLGSHHLSDLTAYQSPCQYCHALLQGIFPTQGSNPVLPCCRRILYHLSHQGSPCSPHCDSDVPITFPFPGFCIYIFSAWRIFPLMATWLTYSLSSGSCSVTISEVLFDCSIQNSKPCNYYASFLLNHITWFMYILLFIHCYFIPTRK